MTTLIPIHGTPYGENMKQALNGLPDRKPPSIARQKEEPTTIPLHNSMPHLQPNRLLDWLEVVDMLTLPQNVVDKEELARCEIQVVGPGLL